MNFKNNEEYKGGLVRWKGRRKYAIIVIYKNKAILKKKYMVVKIEFPTELTKMK